MKPSRNFVKRYVDAFFTRMESTRTSDRWLLRGLFFIVILSGVFSLYQFNTKYSVVTPVQGGELREGIIGTPRFVNPTLAITRADQDATALIYSGLMKIDENGDLVPDIAESMTISDDGRTYNITLRRDVTFHDGMPLTARDVIYTISLIQDPDLKSPLRGNWSDVAVEQVNEYELNIILEEAYAPFVENLLVGILPTHLWSVLPIEQIPFSQLNTEPIGSGPFMIERVSRDASGIITGYHLDAFRDRDKSANIDSVILQFYREESALIADLEQNLIDASAYVSNEALNDLLDRGQYKLLTEPLPRIFAVFFNQNRSAVVRDDAVRNALSVAIDREALIAEALSGYGVPTFLPTTFSSSTVELQNDFDTSLGDRQTAASTILTEAGWEQNELGLWEKEIDGSNEVLSITIKTSNVPLFDQTVQFVAGEWEKIGVEVSIEQYEQSDLVQSVIRPRSFEGLLFGLEMSRATDLYPFWHSSQRDDPGLNIAEYTNLAVDAFLESARSETNEEVHMETELEAGIIIANEQPAVFLFQPQLTYLIREDIVAKPLTGSARVSDRFSNSAEWYTRTDSLWGLFRQETN